MVERFFRYRNKAETYDCAAVTMHGLLMNVQRERDGLQNVGCFTCSDFQGHLKQTH